MNRELHATFDLSAFAHEAFYDEAEGRIEIYVRSLEPQSVTVAGQRFEFAVGERVHTEYSYKYDTADLAALPRAAASASQRPGPILSGCSRSPTWKVRRRLDTIHSVQYIGLVIEYAEDGSRAGS